MYTCQMWSESPQIRNGLGSIPKHAAHYVSPACLKDFCKAGISSWCLQTHEDGCVRLHQLDMSQSKPTTTCCGLSSMSCSACR